jgi:hypothetical protein
MPLLKTCGALLEVMIEQPFRQAHSIERGMSCQVLYLKAPVYRGADVPEWGAGRPYSWIAAACRPRWSAFHIADLPEAQTLSGGGRILAHTGNPVPEIAHQRPEQQRFLPAIR